MFMPKRNETNIKSKLFSKRVSRLSIFGIVFSAILLFFIINAFQDSIQRGHETRAFKSLKQTVDMVSDRINMNLGYPVKYKIDNRCERASVKFGGGWPYCVVEMGGNYTSSSAEEAKEKADKIKSELLKQPGFVAQGQLKDTETAESWKQEGVLEYTTSSSKFKISCSLKFNFLSPGTVNRMARPGDEWPGTLGYSLYCRENTADLYY